MLLLIIAHKCRSLKIQRPQKLSSRALKRLTAARYTKESIFSAVSIAQNTELGIPNNPRDIRYS
ncbi:MULTISPECIES: hypothetical protein [unclassified Microcoleus]|uniref:hypothetical protein n=1 Tax=unclassified Microcoleus TaxID=2642155 RepID=UPI002FD3DAA7